MQALKFLKEFFDFDDVGWGPPRANYSSPPQVGNKPSNCESVQIRSADQSL